MPKVEPVSYIVNARHYAQAHGLRTARDFILKLREEISRSRSVPLPILGLEEELRGVPVKARIWQAQWIADCECGGASFIDPEDPVFFCFSCGNRSNDQRPRPVTVPKDWRKIESLLLERPVSDLAGLTDLERVALAKPVIFVEGKGGLSRNWLPGESVEDLMKQNAPIAKWKKASGAR